MRKSPDSKPTCVLHNKKLKIICTNPLCKNPRFLCTNCLYDPSHCGCITRTILYTDLLENRFTDKLKNWIDSDIDRKRLNEITEITIPTIKGNIALILKKIEELKVVFIEEIDRFFTILTDKIKENEALKVYDDHFSINTLKTMLSGYEKNASETLNDYFSVTSQEFLKVFDNIDYNPSLNYDKNLINKLFSDKIQQMKDVIPEFLTTKLSFAQLLPTKPLRKALKAGNPMHKVIRFKKHEGSIWNFDRQYPDYISFEASKPIRIYGFGMYKTRTITHKWKVLAQIIEGGESNGKVLQKKDFVFINNVENKEFIAKCLFEPIDLPAKSLLTLYIWVQGPDTLGGMEGVAMVKNDKDGVEFKFVNTKVKEDNGTNVKVGQIPEIYYSLLDNY